MLLDDCLDRVYGPVTYTIYRFFSFFFHVHEIA